MTAKNKRASEPRRANKPLMEKRRRARINQSLAALKALILDSAKADNTKHSKLEKADILELTVRHFQRHRSLDIKGINQYKAGYSDCVREVQRYMDTPDAQTMTIIDTGVRQRLLRHLDSCVSEVDMDIRNAVSSVAPTTLPPAPPAPVLEDRLQPPDSSTLEEVNNNNNCINSHVNINNRLDPVKELENLPPALPPQPQIQPQPQLPNGSKLQKNYDGNFVLLLPEHYFQLANALGVNLRPPLNEPLLSGAGTPSNAVERDPGISPEKMDISENGTEVSYQQTYHSGEDQKAEPAGEATPPPERALDYRKNNDDDSGDNMWRPW